MGNPRSYISTIGIYGTWHVKALPGRIPLRIAWALWETRWVLDSEGEFALLRPNAAASDRTGVAVSRTMAVLRALRRPGVGEQPLAVIAESAGLPAPTAHRYLQALVREGAVEQRGPRARYSLIGLRHDSPPSLITRRPSPDDQVSPAVRAELVRMQSRTGQIALAYRPHLIGSPMRICEARACGAHGEELLTAPRAALQTLEAAPLEADAAGLVILACLGPAASRNIDTSRIRAEGHAVGPSSLRGRTMIAAPLWFGPVVAGSVALLAGDAQMERLANRSRYIAAVMDTAAAMSARLTRSLPRKTG
ncbi:helix-turn-helix domain-containing protein [Streptomyces puniciscabiei]|uniref:helix-turn-helix domain-containing protein n=1 Tax=Streptomyces puniciscabiei TaxID=164348 RepID=UPI0033244DA4